MSFWENDVTAVMIPTNRHSKGAIFTYVKIRAVVQNVINIQIDTVVQAVRNALVEKPRVIS